MIQPTIVFVQLGRNPSPTLNHFARAATINSPGSDVLLITDHPDDHYRFPGTVLNYVRDLEFETLTILYKKFKERIELSGGYWIYTLERLFALMQLSKLKVNSAIIHLESDVLISMTTEHFEKLSQMCRRTSVPRHSGDLGIASFLYAPSLQQLTTDLELLGKILDKHLSDSTDFLTDMQLLGLGLNESILQELPTLPNDAWILESGKENRKLVFDGAAYGQYLFGQDPLHNHSMRVSGFQNLNFPLNLKNCCWSLHPSITPNHTVAYDWDLSRIEIANIHVHSKEILEIPNTASLRWQRAIGEANGLIDREVSGPFPDVIHNRRLRFISQLRLSRQSGKIAKLFKFAQRLSSENRHRN